MSEVTPKKDPLGSCRELLDKYAVPLTTVAQEALDDGHEPEDILVFCVETEDDRWLAAIAELHKSHDTETYGEGEPVHMGVIGMDVAIKTLGPLMPWNVEVLAARQKNDSFRILFVNGSSIALTMQKIAYEGEAQPN